MFDSNHVQNDFIYQTGGSILILSENRENIFHSRSLSSLNWFPHQKKTEVSRQLNIHRNHHKYPIGSTLIGFEENEECECNGCDA
jgi:hypothetical protein